MVKSKLLQRRGAVVITTAHINSTKFSDSVQAQTLLAACWSFMMVRMVVIIIIIIIISWWLYSPETVALYPKKVKKFFWFVRCQTSMLEMF